MKLIRPEKIKLIDDYASETLGISTVTLMNRAAEAVFSVITELMPSENKEKKVNILVGGGNNGGDGYALALLLCDSYDTVVLDVFSLGQRSDAGKYYLNKVRERGIPIIELRSPEELSVNVNADLIVDAVFGTGAHGPYSEAVAALGRAIGASDAIKVAIDVPLGVNADTGECEPFTPRYDATVELCAIKRGVVSYPAREHAGRISLDTLGLPMEKLICRFGFDAVLVGEAEAREYLPRRKENSNKGSFGRLSLFVGSDKYFGASALCLEAALRGGVGYTTLFGEADENNLLKLKFPEAIYKERKPFPEMTEGDIKALLSCPETSQAVVIGCGCGVSEALGRFVIGLLGLKGGVAVVDADAINSLALLGEEGIAALKNARRPVVLTPHPLEFSRLSGIRVEEINNNRIGSLVDFASAIRGEGIAPALLLKGAGSLILGGDTLYINSSGSSALAKAGSGDVLAGLIGALVASEHSDVTSLCALASYLHGRAGDTLAKDYSDFGVTPSDLPKAIAKEIAELSKNS